MTLTDQLLAAWTTFLSHVEQPKLLWLIPILAVFIFWLVRRDFVKLLEDHNVRRRRKRIQWVIFFLRTLAVAALVLALTSPFMQRQKTIESDPSLKLLVDSSQSMDVYNTKVADDIKAKLEQTVAVELQSIASGASSPIGDGILNSVRDGENVILITDGQATSGASLGDVAVFASTHNVTFNVLNLEPVKDDAWVRITGPEKTVAKVDNTLTIESGWATKDAKPLHLVVSIDGRPVLDTTDSLKSHTITQQFGEGYHRIEARVEADDPIPANNVYYKVLKVVPKPKIALWTPAEGTPMETLLRQVYDVAPVASLPTDLDPYYAVVSNGIGLVTDDETARLSEYLDDGNGMVVVGGQGAYDKGSYKNSYFETLLPVVVGTPGKEQGDVNIVILMDASLSVSSDEGGGIKTSRQLTIDILNQMSANVKVGINAFRNIPIIVAPIGYKSDLVGVEQKLATVYGAGSSKMHLGILQAIDMLKGTVGSKNLIIISDGMLFPNDQQAAKDAVLAARKAGVKVYTVGVAIGSEAFVADRTDEDVMKSLAATGGGIYFRARDTSRFNLLFGNVEPPKPGVTQEWGVAVLDSNHFITDGLDVNATITGYNAVSPKTTGRMLVTTSTGEPIITTWHLGLGRVAAYSTDDGSAWAGQMLSSGSSKLIVRMVNWVNGDPDRKRSSFVDVKDTRINEPTQVTLKASTQPTANGVAFYKIRPDTYQAEVTPTTVGFHDILGATYAANYPAELAPLGPSLELDRLVRETGGRYFNVGEESQMIEFAKSHSVKSVTGKDYLRWELALLAAGLFLLEILLRRILRR